MATADDRVYRRRLIARVEILRTAQSMTRLRFRQLIGPVAARCWTDFVDNSDEEAWNHFSLKVIESIAKGLGVGAVEILIFTSQSESDAHSAAAAIFRDSSDHIPRMNG
jgi:hypothetical protein